MTYLTMVVLGYLYFTDWNCYREPGRGSGFIQSLVEVFSEDAKKCDIVEMLTKVNRFHVSLNIL